MRIDTFTATHSFPSTTLQALILALQFLEAPGTRGMTYKFEVFELQVGTWCEIHVERLGRGNLIILMVKLRPKEDLGRSSNE